VRQAEYKKNYNWFSHRDFASPTRRNVGSRSDLLTGKTKTSTNIVQEIAKTLEQIQSTRLSAVMENLYAKLTELAADIYNTGEFYYGRWRLYA